MKHFSFIQKFISIVLFAGLGTMVINPVRADNPQSIYLDTHQSIAKRVADLVSRMTLAEKVGQMQTDAPAIPRLGIPAYYWWSESLHGDAVDPATVFPEPIGLASTFDLSLHAQVATAISDEDRATYNKTVQDGQPESFHGLTFFAPNINIFRDPRWGRGQETYGEDPYLTGQLGIVYVKGLQGSDKRYLKVVATPKHFAVHSGPEPERHRFDAVVSDYDLNDTYLPAFKASVMQGHAYSVMGAYSALDGVPDCASNLLLQKTLREKWGFEGYVVSDCGAIGDIFYGHNYAKSMPEASADAVKAGCDLTCGTEYSSLIDAVKQGLITEADIDRSVKRLFTARFKLGMFDPPSQVPYDKIPFSVIDSPSHRDLARQAARESLVLLKNDGHLLPLSKSLKNIAVIGPNADELEVLFGNYNGTPTHAVTAFAGIKAAVSPQTTVTYVQGTGLTGQDNLTPVPASALQNSGQPGLKAEYFDNETLEGTPKFTRTDSQIRFNWAGGNPVPGLPTLHISARWTGDLVAPQDGEYTLSVRGDDGFRLYIKDQKVIDDWGIHPAEDRTYKLTLTTGQTVPIRLEYYQAEGEAEILLSWQKPGGEVFSDALAAARQADVVVYVGGISSALEGEEGTNGNGDRTDINLPKVQEDLLEALAAVGKPVVLALMNGSALSVNWAKEHIPAIVESWYPGEEGGTALADVLFGDYNPAGRLPVTFYQSADQLPAFTDYAMKNRTYRYFTGQPLYAFGYGLSYTQFQYTNLHRQGPQVSADIENIGDRAGDEVAELYLRPAPNASVRQITPDQPMPRLELAGFQRIGLAPHQKKTVTFTLTPDQLLLVNAQGERMMQPGTWQVFVGGHQPDLDTPITSQSDLLTQTITVSR